MSKIYKKQPLDIVVSGITLRYSMKYNIWVNWAGTRTRYTALCRRRQSAGYKLRER